MGGIKFSFYPLFFVFAFYYALTGRILIFLLYGFSAIIHELGHSLAAQSFGYELNKIKLTPFGATITGDSDFVRAREEIAVSFAGPLVNLAVGISFVAAWWIFPETYAFTDTAAEVNFSLAAINLLPFAPLDGGRIFVASLGEKIGRKRAEKISKFAGLCFSVLLGGVFVVTLFYSPNPSVLLFGVFVAVGALEKGENSYTRAYFSATKKRLRRGVPYKKQCVDVDTSVKRILKILDSNAVNEIAVYDGESCVAVLNQKKIAEIAEKGDYYAPVSDYLI